MPDLHLNLYENEIRKILLLTYQSYFFPWSLKFFQVSFHIALEFYQKVSFGTGITISSHDDWRRSLVYGFLEVTFFYFILSEN